MENRALNSHFNFLYCLVLTLTAINSSRVNALMC